MHEWAAYRGSRRKEVKRSFFRYSSRTSIWEFGLIGFLVSLIHCLYSVVFCGGAVRMEKDRGLEKSMSFAQVSGRLGLSHSLP